VKYVFAGLIFIGFEVAGLAIFAAIKRLIGPEKGSPANRLSVFKGILERFALFVGLLHGYPQILIAFAALKLGTRLSEEQGSKISNNYFLVGNLMSVLLAMVAAICTGMVWKG
jgi:hypothetical protein